MSGISERGETHQYVECGEQGGKLIYTVDGVTSSTRNGHHLAAKGA